MAKTFAKFTKVEIVDKNGNAIEITSDGKLKMEVTNDNVFDEILIQLKLNNAYMEQIIGEKLTILDIEE